MSREVVVVSGVRTPIGTFGGSLKDFAPTKLGALVVREALQRASVNGDEVGQVVFGNVIQTEPRDMYLSRVAAIDAGVTKDAPAMNVNRLCGSGLQALVSAAQAILLGGNVRVGLEDNLWLDKGVPASNGSLTQRVVEIITRMGATPMTPAQGREKMGLKKRG